MESINTGHISVADFIGQRLKASGRSASEVSASCGWDKPNVLELITQGRLKLPINKVRLLADALGVSPANLLRLTMREYMPETYEAVREVLECEFLSDFERDALDACRHVSGDGQVDICITRSDPLVIVTVPVWEKRTKSEPNTPGERGS